MCYWNRCCICQERTTLPRLECFTKVRHVRVRACICVFEAATKRMFFEVKKGRTCRWNANVGEIDHTPYNIRRTGLAANEKCGSFARSVKHWQLWQGLALRLNISVWGFYPGIQPQKCLLRTPGISYGFQPNAPLYLYIFLFCTLFE